MKKRVNPATLGAFVVTGLALVTIVAVIVGSGRLFRDTATFVSFFEGEVNGMVLGSPVSYRGVNIGQVKEVLISLERDPRDSTDVRIPVIYELDLTRVRSLARRRQGDLTDPTILNSLVETGLRAKMESESMVTGRKMIVLGVWPDVPDNRLPPGTLDLLEIPTHPNTLQEIQDRVLQASEAVARMDLEGLVNNLNNLIVNVNDIVTSPGVEGAANQAVRTLEAFEGAAEDLSALAMSLDSVGGTLSSSIDRTTTRTAETLESLERTLADLRMVLDPESPLNYRAGQTLAELEAAARAIRSLAEYLEQNPSALLKGRGGSEEEE
jgi:paraquat-inducible protein B